MFMEGFRVPIPDEKTRIKDGKVQCKIFVDKWSVIGKLPPEGTVYDADGRQLMIPNGVYRKYMHYSYRQDVASKDPDNIPTFFHEDPSVGAYALILGVAEKSGLYDILIDVFGIEAANALLDLALYYNLRGRTDLEDIDSRIADLIVFSVRAHTEEWYQDRIASYGKGSVTEESIQRFLQRWTAHRQKTHPRDTEIHVTATHADWGLSDRGIPEMGVFAVCEAGGETPGLPLAYHLYDGYAPKREDAEAALQCFRDLNLAPKRIVSGKDFCHPKLLALWDSLSLPWAVMLRPYYAGPEAMLDRHEEELMQGKGTPIASKLPMLAVCEEDVLLIGPEFEDPDRKGFVALYCMPKDAAKERVALQKKLDKVYPEACAALEKLQASAENPLPVPDPAAGKDADGKTAEEKAMDILYDAVCDAGGLFYRPNQYAWNSLKLVYDTAAGKYSCVIDEDEVQYYRCLAGFVSMGSSEPMDPQALSDAFPLSYYQGDSTFAPVFSAMSYQLNSDTPYSMGFSAWFFVAFLADTIRAMLLPSYKLFEAEKRKHVEAEAQRRRDHPEECDEYETGDPNFFCSIGEMLSWMGRIRYSRLSANADFYWYCGYRQSVLVDALEAAGIPQDTIDYFASLVSRAEYPDEVRRLRQEKRTIPVPWVPKQRGRKKAEPQ